MNFSGVVLAGGKSRRMGFPKHLIESDGVPLWRRQADLLRRAGARPVALSLAADQPAPDEEMAIVRDGFPDCGPLGGIAAALAWSEEPLVFVLAVDLAFMSLTVVREILDGCDGGRGCVPCLDGFAEPLAAIYPQSALNLATQRLKAGQRAARGFVDACVASNLVCMVSIAEKKSFQNMNRPENLPARKT